MMRQRNSIGKKNKTIDEFKKHLPLIVRGNHNTDEDKGTMSSLLRTDPLSFKKPFSKPIDRSISLRGTPKEEKQEHKSLNESRFDYYHRPGAKMSFGTPYNNLIMKNNKDGFKKLSIKRNVTMISTPHGPLLDSSLGFKRPMPEEMLTRTELYSKIKNKPSSTKASGNEMLRLEKTFHHAGREPRQKRKSKLMESIDLKPIVSNTNPEPAVNFKRVKSTKAKAKSFDNDINGRMPLYDRKGENSTVEDPSARVPYSLVPSLDQARHSSTSFKYVKSYAVNTYKGLIRDYNEDRVSIILNIVQPDSKRNVRWPNCSFFGVNLSLQGI